MLKSISELMDLPEEEQELLLTEFQHKYIGSHLEIITNTETIISRVHNISVIRGLCIILPDDSHRYIKLPDIIKIKEFNPPEGLYKCIDSYYYLVRIPQRQYTKSFALGKTYNIWYITGNNDFSIEKAEFLGKTAIISDQLFFFWKCVGTLTNNKIEVFTKYKSLLPEITELWKQYHIILENPLRSATTTPKKMGSANVKKRPAKPIPMEMILNGLEPQIRPRTVRTETTTTTDTTTTARAFF